MQHAFKIWGATYLGLHVEEVSDELQQLKREISEMFSVRSGQTPFLCCLAVISCIFSFTSLMYLLIHITFPKAVTFFLIFSPVDTDGCCDHTSIQEEKQAHVSLSSLSDMSTMIEGTLFRRKRFLLLGFSKEDECCIRGLIEENAGKVLLQQNKAIADYAVVPLLGCKVDSTVGEVVTNTWLVRTNIRITSAIYNQKVSVNSMSSMMSGIHTSDVCTKIELVHYIPCTSDDIIKLCQYSHRLSPESHCITVAVC